MSPPHPRACTVRHSRPRPWLASLLLGCSLSAASAATPPAIATPAARDADPDQVLVREVDALARAIVDTGHVPGLGVALTRGDRILLSKGYGERVAGSGVAVDADTQFRIASVSKTFTATLVGVLVDRGYAKWSDPVVDLVPGFQLKQPEVLGELTLERLLSHQTGLPFHALDRELESSDEPLKVRAALPGVKLHCAPGACYGYQNVAFAYAADAVFASAGTFFETALRREVLAPLGLWHTSVGRDGLLGAANHALPHVWGPLGPKPIEPKPNYYWLPAAAGVNASIRDLTRWLLAHQGHRPDVLRPELLQALHSPRVATPYEVGGSRWRRTRLLSAGYGLGFRVFDYQGHTVVFHAGAVDGARAIMAFAPQEDVGVALVWNANSGVPGGLLPYVMDRWLGLDGVDWLELDKVQPTQLALKARAAREQAAGVSAAGVAVPRP